MSSRWHRCERERGGGGGGGQQVAQVRGQGAVPLFCTSIAGWCPAKACRVYCLLSRAQLSADGYVHAYVGTTITHTCCPAKACWVCCCYLALS